MSASYDASAHHRIDRIVKGLRVTLEEFDVEGFLGYLVHRYEEQRSHARGLIDRIRRGESPISI